MDAKKPKKFTHVACARKASAALSVVEKHNLQCWRKFRTLEVVDARLDACVSEKRADTREYADKLIAVIKHALLLDGPKEQKN